MIASETDSDSLSMVNSATQLQASLSLTGGNSLSSLRNIKSPLSLFEQLKKDSLARCHFADAQDNSAAAGITSASTMLQPDAATMTGFRSISAMSSRSATTSAEKRSTRSESAARSTAGRPRTPASKFARHY